MLIGLFVRMCSPQVVKERLLCHAIIGRAGGKELIMRVPVSCEFITPLLQFSADTVSFRVDKVGALPHNVQSGALLAC